ncbi:unnamed protein product [Paramecium octaurelia]|uniref:Uncharacterized protein n=1 Tax=Paramecium octaurelia TaxID=43137 RepID=A0A8S1Y241_PAROT|nr:unnamed protein product [Paramecium octaurelia]
MTFRKNCFRSTEVLLFYQLPANVQPTLDSSASYLFKKKKDYQKVSFFFPQLCSYSSKRKAVIAINNITSETCIKAIRGQYNKRAVKQKINYISLMCPTKQVLREIFYHSSLFVTLQLNQQ